MRPSAVAILTCVFTWQLLARPLYDLTSWAQILSGATGGTPTSATPDFLLLTLLYIALRDRSTRVLWAAAIFGGLVDAFSLDPPGTHLLSYLFAVYLLRLSQLEGWADNLLPRSVLLLLGLTAATATRLQALWLSAPEYSGAAASALAAELAYTAIVGALMFPLLDLYGASWVRQPQRKLVEA